jgi:hypothetical protein
MSSPLQSRRTLPSSGSGSRTSRYSPRAQVVEIRAKVCTRTIHLMLLRCVVDQRSEIVQFDRIGAGSMSLRTSCEASPDEGTAVLAPDRFLAPTADKTISGRGSLLAEACRQRTARHIPRLGEHAALLGELSAIAMRQHNARPPPDRGIPISGANRRNSGHIKLRQHTIPSPARVEQNVAYGVVESVRPVRVEEDHGATGTVRDKRNTRC